MCFVMYMIMTCFIVHLDEKVELVKPLVFIREVSISNLGFDTVYPDSCSVFFFRTSQTSAK